MAELKLFMDESRGWFIVKFMGFLMNSEGFVWDHKFWLVKGQRVDLHSICSQIFNGSFKSLV